MVTRGGSQPIPRPERYEAAGPAPWAHLGLAGGAITLDTVRSAVVAHQPPQDAPDVASARPSAVLVPVFEIDGDARVVLTKRPETMPSHRGQIAFPGGKHEPALDADLEATALREAEEEIALEARHVDVVGRLDGVGTMASQFVITPFVGVLDAPVELVAHPREVVAVFDVAIRDLLADEVFRRERWMLEGVARDMDFYELPGETVWGATARMLTNLLQWITGVS